MTVECGSTVRYGSTNQTINMAQEFNDNADAAVIRAIINAFVQEYNAHAVNTGNPHGVTKQQVGLGNAENTADMDKPASNAVLTLLAGKYSTSNPSNYINAAQVLSAVLTGFVSDTGVIDDTNTVLAALQKLYGNNAALDAALDALVLVVNGHTTDISALDVRVDTLESSSLQYGMTAVASTQFKFDRPTLHGSKTAPRTGNVTVDFTGAKLGVTSLMVHNDGAPPTFPAAFKERTDGAGGGYQVGQDNYIEAQYHSNTHVTYKIYQTV